MDRIIMKVTFEGTTRRVPVTSGISFADLHKLFADRFSISVPFVSSYEDSDKDIITFDSDAELSDLFSTIEDSSKPVRISLATLDHAQETAKATCSTPTADADQANPQVESLISKISDLVSAIEANLNATDQPLDNTGNQSFDNTTLRGFYPTANTPIPDAAPCERPPRKGVFFGLRQYIAAFPSGRSGFKKHATSVSPEVKICFKKLVRYIKSDEDTSNIVHALKDNAPTFRKWVVSDLGDEGLPDESEIDQIVKMLREDLLPKIGERATSRITSFVRFALTDEGVITMLRKLRALGPMPWEEGFSFSRIGKCGPRGFDVHAKIQCNNCGMKPIVGTRFKCTNRKNFNLCKNCYENENVSKEDMQFTECQYVWENVFAGKKVPPSPLKIGDRGPRVKFLHKLLTDAGFMNESMYLKQMGLYSAKTQAAVKQFQQEKGLGSTAEDGVYDDITAKCLENMLENHNVNPEASPGIEDQPEPTAMEV